MFKGYLKSNLAFLLCLFAITILDVILIFRGQIIAISNLMFISLYISVDYRFYKYREFIELTNNKSIFELMDDFNKSMDELTKDMEKMFGRNKKNDEEDNSKGEN